MRRKNLEVVGYHEIVEIMQRCRVARIALIDGDYPYIVPMNFGIEYDKDKINLYFHCAGEGKRYDLIKKNNKVGFEMDVPYRLSGGGIACEYEMEYESVIGKGLIEILPDEEKERALNILMRHYAVDGREFTYTRESLDKTTALKLSVTEITGKRNIKD